MVLGLHCKAQGKGRVVGWRPQGPARTCLKASLLAGSASIGGYTNGHCALSLLLGMRGLGVCRLGVHGATLTLAVGWLQRALCPATGLAAPCQCSWPTPTVLSETSRGAEPTA